MRVSLVAFLIATWSAVTAFAGSKPEDFRLSGVWTGHIGTLPITACFNDEWGSYYYHRHLVPIELRPPEEGRNDKKISLLEMGGTWQIINASPSRINGTWNSRDNSRSLPIVLTQVRLSKEDAVEGTTSCESSAYNQLIEKSIKTRVGPLRTTGNFHYRTITTALPGEDHYTTTIELIGNSQAIASINKSLRALVEDESNLLWCRRAALRVAAREGRNTQDMSATAFGPLLMVQTRTSTDCGERTQASEATHFWNLVTGKPESLFSWFNEADSAKESADSVQLEGALPKDLDIFVSKRFGQGDPSNHLSREELEQCYGEYAPGAYSYQLQLAEDGINFNIPVTSNGSCGESINLTFRELAPYLNQQGKRAVAAIQSAKKVAKP